jgi:hypothetical protein
VRYSPSNPRPVAKALTAAYSPIPDPAKQFKNPIGLAQRTGWQTEAWDMLDKVGELRYYVSWRAMSCSRVRFIASELDETGKPTGTCSNDRVNEIAQGLGGATQAARAQFIKRSVEQLTVPGETFQSLIFNTKTEQEEWYAFSRDEIRKVDGDDSVVTLPNKKEHKLSKKNGDSIWRCWNPHPRIAHDADSPVKACLSPLREIVTTTATIEGAGKSRLLGAGVVFVPTEMSLPAANAPVSADKPGDPMAAVNGVAAVTQLEELLYAVARHSYENDDSFARSIPIFASVAGEQIKNINHLKLDTEYTKEAIATRNDAIARLALGLDVSPERLMGIGSSSNHWSAWEIGDNDVALHIAPVMELICDTLNQAIFRNMLIAEGMDPDAYTVWYDPSELTADPDKSDDATDAFDRSMITGNAFRAFLNLGDTGYDLTTKQGWADWARDRIGAKPELITNLAILVPELAGIDFPELAQIESAIEADKAKASAPDTNAPTGKVPDTEKAKPGYDQGKRGKKSTVGKSLDRADPFVRIFVTRALELVGKRRRNTRDEVQRARLAGHRAHEFHRLMDPVDEQEIPRLMSGWDDTLEDDVLALLGVDRHHFSQAVVDEVRRQLTAEVVTVDS